MYVSPNFQTKKKLKEAVANGEAVGVYQPGIGPEVENGAAFVEGPHYPKPHKWYAKVLVKNGLIKVVK